MKIWCEFYYVSITSCEFAFGLGKSFVAIKLSFADEIFNTTKFDNVAHI